MFDWFHNRVPYTDYQQKNLDWLTETVREGEAAVEAKIEEADTAIENAEAATEAANTAKTGADDAATAANNAATAANNAKDAANTAAANAQAAADKWATPYASTTVAGMTDHAKIYVYTGTEVGYTAGNWYYWNGTAWTSGGVYVGDISDAVLFSTAQSKTDAEKAQAQSNMGLISDTSVLSGSYYQTYAMDLSPDNPLRIEVVSTTEHRNISIYAMPDIGDTGQNVFLFTLKEGEIKLWEPTTEYEGLHVAVNGNSVVNVTPMSGPLQKVQKVIHCGTGCEFTKIKDALEYSCTFMDSIVYVLPGTYDIISEFGAAYFESLTASDSSLGIRLGNRVHVIFSPNSKVVCNYTGSNEYACKNFSPFHVWDGGFTLENMTLIASKVRYCVHDERNGGTEYCESNYKNCYMSIDNNSNPYFGSTAPTCIGGGLGSNHVVNIENCIFHTNKDGYGAGVYYHQSNKTTNPNHKCYLSIKDNYFIKGTVILDFIRTDASEDTNVLVSGNSFPTISGQDSQGVWSVSMTGNHANLYEWNNVIRS